MGSKQRLRAERRKLDGQNLSVKFTVTGDDDPQGIDVSLDPAQLTASDPEIDPGGGVTIDFSQPDPEPAAPAEIEVETDDDDGPDPFEELQRQFEETKAAREAAEARAKELETAESRLRAEAEQARADRKATEARWREEQNRRDELEVLRIRSEKDLLVSHKGVLDHALAAAEVARAKAQSAYAEAMAQSDYDRAAEAQAQISDAIFERRRIAEGIDRIQEQIDAPVQEYRREPEPQRQTDQDPWEVQIANYSEGDKNWLRKHKDDLANNPERQLLAQDAHNKATERDGLMPGRPQYYAALDAMMGYSAPAAPATQTTEQPAETTETTPAPKPVAKRPTAAPASRSTSSSQPTKVFLTEWQQADARAQKVSYQEYAKAVATANKNQLTSEQAGGRLMARYTA